MKKCLLLLVTIMMAIVGRAADGNPFTYENLTYRILSEINHTVEVGRNDSASGEISIPSSVNFNGVNYDVTVIGADAFSGCNDLISVTIPESVYAIRKSAFSGCSGLTSVVIPNSVHNIEYEAFSGCSGLTSVVIPEAVTSIDYSTFSGCTSLTSVIIPESVTYIGDWAFNDCSGMISVRIPNSVTYIGSRAFAGCSKLRSVEIPASVTSIEHSIFLDCISLTSVTIPESVTSIENQAFWGCKSLTSVIIPESVTTIGSSAFYGCSKLRSVKIPESVKSIGGAAFYECGSLTSVTIPESVTSIGNYTFYHCPSLTSVIIPESVTSIGNYAFYDCDGLTSVIIPESVTSIGDYAFSDCYRLTSVIIPESVTYIGDSAFFWCSSLTSVIIPESVNSIGDDAFSRCTSLKSIIDFNPIPTSLGVDAFSGVPTDAVVYVPKGSTESYLSAEGWNRFSDFREMGDFEISISEATLALYKGESADLTVVVVKDEDVIVGEHKWVSSNPEVATVDDGKVTAIAPGTAEIRYTEYTIYGGVAVPNSVTCTVTVSEAPVLVDSITLDLTTIEAKEGSEIQLTATVAPADATNKEIAWSSSDENIATVSETGLVKIHRSGTCVITATTTDGSDLKAECMVSVLSNIKDIHDNATVVVDVFNMEGILVLSNATEADIRRLSAGIYIIVQGDAIEKIVVK